MDGGVLVGRVGYEAGDLVLLGSGEERILRQEAVVAVLDVLELGGVHVGGMQLFAHFRKFRGIPGHVFGIVACGARIRLLAEDAPEADAVAAVFGNHVLTGFRGGDTHVVNLAGQVHLVQRLLDLARKIELEHD